VAFPSSGPATGTAATFSTTFNLPASYSPGQLLLMWIIGDSIAGDTMSPWTKVTNASNGTQMIALYAKIAAGGDTTSLSGVFTGRAAQSRAVDLSDATIANISTAAITTNSIDPPSLAAGATREHLWFAVCRTNAAVTTAGPTNYSDFTVTGASGANLSTAWRQRNINTEDPGAFTGTATNALAMTVSIRPGFQVPLRQTPLVPRINTSYNW
jgi:hypothetical protein